MKITMAHGSGGRATSELIGDVFARHFGNQILNAMEDAAVVPGSGTIAVTTDSFVVDPLFYPGGDIGTLSVCGTVNDLAMSGAEPKYLTCGFILEEGLDIGLLDSIALSMKNTAEEAGVLIVAGDTKVIGGSGGVYINTSGVGFVPGGRRVSPKQCEAGDVLLVSGTMGDHHAAILSARMSIQNTIQSDCAPLNKMAASLFEAGIAVKAMRDITRGGLATILNEFAAASGCGIEVVEAKVPVSGQVAAFCGILGLDPLYMGNEGKMLLAVSQKDADRALAVLKSQAYGRDAAIIGRFVRGDTVALHTKLGGKRNLDVLYGEGLPRIC